MARVLVSIRVAGPPPSPRDPSPENAPTVRPTVWRGIDDPNETLLLLEFPSEAAVKEDLIRWTARNAPVPPTTREIVHVSVEREGGAALAQAPLEAFLIVSRDLSLPGHGEEARRSAGEVLRSLDGSLGLLGYLQGYNPTLPDEVWVLAFGTQDPRFLASLDPSVSLRTYRRES
jgi:hypothetical protein